MISPQQTNQSPVAVSLVAVLPLILIPLVISGFFLVYALVGGVLEGDSLVRWMDEAWSVALPTGLIQLGCCFSVVAWARYKRLAWTHLLNTLSFVNAGLAVVLVGLVYYWSH